MPQVGKLARFNGLRNLKIAALTTDTAAATAYGTAVSLGAQSRLTFAPQFQSSDLRTSSGLENRRSYVDHLTWSVTYGELNLDALDIALNGMLHQIAESGVGAGDSKSIFALKQGLANGYFGIIGQPDVVEAGPADLYVCLLKCQVDSMDPAPMGEGWASITMSGQGLYTLKDKALFGIAVLEKVTDITFAVALTDIQTALASGT